MIVVGVDGSDFSLRAVEWASGEAVRRGQPLLLVHAVPPWLYDTPVDPRVGAVREWLLGGGREIVDRAAAYARESDPNVSVDSHVTPGSPAQVLLEAAGRASMIVIACHGAGTATDLLLGSVALQVVSHARVPVVVVRQLEPGAHGEVVVGVDGSGYSRQAIGFAFEEAAIRHARLRALRTWRHPASSGPGDMQPLVYSPSLVTADEERGLAESLAGWREKYPDVEVIQEVVHGGAVRILAGASARADLLVVGTRGRGGFPGLLLGSVSHSLLHQAHCPLAVVPPEEAP